MANKNEATIDEAQLKNILVEVQAELDKMAKSEMQKLSKARPGESTTGEDEADTSQTDPTGDNTSASASPPPPASASPDSAGSDSAPPADDASASPPPGDDGSAPPMDDGSAPTGDPAADQGPIDPQQLMAEYSKLPLEDMKLHYQALKEALVQAIATSGGDDGSAAAPPPGPDASAGAPPPPPAPPAGGPPAPDASGPTLKAEIPAGNKLSSPGPENGENPLHKAEIDALKEQIKKQDAALGTLVKAVKTVVEAPLRKSITSVADLAPATSAPDVSKMSRDQIRAKLKVLAGTSTLSKSDRELITGFDLKTVKADQIVHLLK